MANHQQYVEALNVRRSFLDGQLHNFRAQEQEWQAEIARLAELQRRNRNELCSYLLAETSDQELRALQERLGFPGLLPIKRRYEGELARAQAERAQMEQLDDVINNEFHVSHARDELEEIREVYERANHEVGLWRSIPWFVALEQRGYFKPGYKAGFFGWLRDWRSISHLMAALEKQRQRPWPHPDVVREAWQKLDEETRPIFELQATLQARLQEVEQLGERHRRLVEAPQRLFEAMYNELSDAIARHIETLPDEAKVQLAREDKHVVLFLQKEVGLTKQIQYLREVQVARLTPIIQGLQQDLNKINAKLQRASWRHKSWYDDNQVSRMRNVRPEEYEKWDKRRTRLARTREQIGGFNKYQRGSFVEDFLWWDLITRGAPGHDIYEVRVFHSAHPHFDYRSYEQPWAWRDHHHHHHHHSSHSYGDDHDRWSSSGDASSDAMDAAADALAAGSAADDGLGVDAS